MAGGPAPYNRKNPAARAEQAAIVFDLKLGGHSFRAIETITAEPGGPTGGERIPWTTARDLVREEAGRRVDPKVDAWRALIVERLEAAHARLDTLEHAARQVLERQHITVNNGRIISLDGAPLPDDGPVLAAIDRLIKIEDARERNAAALRRVFGIDAPAKTEVQVTETTQQDIELQEMVAEMRAKNTNVTDGLRARRENGE
ncbi:hypothetical protein [Streptomyces sp. NPDC060027]|uniref:hypothetical protein n=1 Tax=Streptomyces sp. NPDC060027 TaxID=3347040 RepID=UPI00369C95A0